MPPTLYSVAIFVTDIERAKTFYRDHLGLSLVKEGSFGAEFCEGGTSGSSSGGASRCPGNGGPSHRRDPQDLRPAAILRAVA